MAEAKKIRTEGRLLKKKKRNGNKSAAAAPQEKKVQNPYGQPPKDEFEGMTDTERREAEIRSWGYELPDAASLEEALYREEYIEWQRLGAFQVRPRG